MGYRTLQEFVASRSFDELFTKLLGWDRISRSFQPITCCGSTASPIAQKRGFMVFACKVHRTDLANRGLLRRHQRELRKLYHEHILIHYCETPRKQVWQWVTSVGDGSK